MKVNEYSLSAVVVLLRGQVSVVMVHTPVVSAVGVSGLGKGPANRIVV